MLGCISRVNGGGVGARPSGDAKIHGFYDLPTVVAGLSNASRLCQDEVFDPVFAILLFDNDEDLISQVNESVYGLAAEFWTRDVTNAWSIGRGLDTGAVWINISKQFFIATPFGGSRENGLGRDKGREGIRAYQQQKSFYLDLFNGPHPWAAATVADTES